MRYEAITSGCSEEIAAIRGDTIVSRGRVHKVRQLSGYLARKDEHVQGLILYDICNNECEIVALNSYSENVGIGTELIELVKNKAITEHLSRLWLITTNDNIKAIRFYQKRGFDMKAIHLNAVDEARLHKPTIPLYNAEGIPIKHEIEFEIKLAVD
ncbi:acetyltransferase (GNAT) family protein [Paenibacillus cellulosilyticus]|uniref:Acetyltransferase (GNAT) family protein n=1 Tax=Paenibacillus cellulosilyticus TaxID=375489 RepID=A0A2V2YLW2_9BACL|nr:GNAT family N-acetyltransferase [Paenibacillus cellulosilyticus]PWV94494.1 acetyltransferase (GNAT) family protein [Paenibacillus cellulosilyticus]QKS45004.1 GNAT family N-acetyltransferase [Paenibacillus cellulosilyticus]